MTGKLLKYELRSSYTYMVAIWAAMLVSSLLASFTPKVTGNESTLVEQFLKEVPTFLFAASAIALGVAMIFIVVFRFYQGLLGDEGYLMHTLPVKEWQLITAKGLAAMIFTIGSGCALVLSLVVFGHEYFFTADFFKACGSVIKVLSAQDYIIGIEAIIIILVSILKTIYQVYAALAVGQLSDKHRLLVSVGAYIGISIAVAVIAAGFLGVFGNSVDLFMSDPFGSEHEFAYIQLLAAIFFFGTVIQVVIFHVITERILSKKLNLV